MQINCDKILNKLQIMHKSDQLIDENTFGRLWTNTVWEPYLVVHKLETATIVFLFF